jgi:hypothetical protein
LNDQFTFRNAINRIDLKQVPFTDRGSRLLVLERDGGLVVRLSERWAKIDPHVVAYRHRPPLLDQFFFTEPNGDLLDFELESYPHCLNFKTQPGHIFDGVCRCRYLTDQPYRIASVAYPFVSKWMKVSPTGAVDCCG